MVEPGSHSSAQINDRNGPMDELKVETPKHENICWVELGRKRGVFVDKISVNLAQQKYIIMV